MRFQNREEAGQHLAARFKEPALGKKLMNPVVVALPRGGLPIGYEIARALNAPLEVLVVRKIGAPGNPEFGIGAVTEGGYHWIDRYSAEALEIDPSQVRELIARESEEVERRVQLYRADHALPSLQGRSVILVDDGLATGVTAYAATRILREMGAAHVVLAVPVCSPDSVTLLESEADEVICLERPSQFYSVSLWYEDFAQLDDAQVRDYLERSRRREELAVCQEVTISSAGGPLEGSLCLPRDPAGLVIFAHGSGSGRHSPRNVMVARALNDAGLGTLLFDLLTVNESMDRANVFDIPLLAERLAAATGWARERLGNFPIGYFGASTGGAAALWAASLFGDGVSAVVSRGGRPDLAIPRLSQVTAPTLLIVGGHDDVVLELNEDALQYLSQGRLVVVPKATHLFEEPGALEQVAAHAISWFKRGFRRARRKSGGGAERRGNEAA